VRIADQHSADKMACHGMVAVRGATGTSPETGWQVQQSQYAGTLVVILDKLHNSMLTAAMLFTACGLRLRISVLSLTIGVASAIHPGVQHNKRPLYIASTSCFLSSALIALPACRIAGSTRS
jgi:hypothetical protein